MSKFRKIFFALALLFAGIFVLTACDKVDLEKAKTALESSMSQVKLRPLLNQI